jgi:hypothetical protein
MRAYLYLFNKRKENKMKNSILLIDYFILHVNDIIFLNDMCTFLNIKIYGLIPIN